MMLSDVCVTDVAHFTRDSDTTFKVKRSKVNVTRPLWLAVLAAQHGHRLNDWSICVYDVYGITTCRPGRGHIVAASPYSLLILHLVIIRTNSAWITALDMLVLNFVSLCIIIFVSLRFPCSKIAFMPQHFNARWLSGWWTDWLTIW